MNIPNSQHCYLLYTGDELKLEVSFTLFISPSGLYIQPVPWLSAILF
jgi:hypothetical protein